MKYIVIGLGNYGSVLAEELTTLGHEVIGVDNDASKVECLKDKVSTSFVLDATDEQALAILPLKKVDIVIVALGKAFGASIKVVALLKKYEVEHIYARALDSIHKSVLEAFNIDLILNPERDAARSLVRIIDIKVNVEALKLDKEHYIVKFKLPPKLAGYKLSDIALEREFNLKVITLLNGNNTTNKLSIPITENCVVEQIDPNYQLCSSDSLVCYGKYKDFMSFWKSI
ncbi:MAG: TrkA family potassium uptake protein [Rikenellaceae bacterium]